MADDLAAEIARHTETRIGRPGREERAICAECYETWPCLVRRLADLLLASEGVLIDAPALAVRENDLRLAAEAERDALRVALARYGVHLHFACELQDVCGCGLDAVRALAPTDGEQPA